MSFRILFSMAFLLFGCSFASGQVLEDKLATDGLQTDFFRLQTNVQGDQAFIKQVGNENEVDLIQFQQANSSSNFAGLLQAGENNKIWVRQSGFENLLLLVQRGEDNFFASKVEGVGNRFLIKQLGDGNRIVQDLINSDQINVEFIQKGDENEIIQELEGPGLTNFKIIQQGDGLKAIIR